MQNKTLQMKRALRTAMLILLLSAMGMGKGYAQDFTVGDLNYSINTDETTVTVTGHVDGTEATGSLVIPDSVTFEGTTYAVTTIGDYAFDGCYGFTGSLNIGNSVTTIGDYAFHGCYYFTGDLTIPNSVASIGDFAFYNCCRLTTLTIGNSVTSIGGFALASCGFTGDLIIPNSVVTIGFRAFAYCNSVTGLTIGDSVTTIEDGAFYGCFGINSVVSLATIPPSFEGEYVFDHVLCTTLTVPCRCAATYESSPWHEQFTTIVEDCASVEEEGWNLVTVYPNPTNGQILIEAEGIKHIIISNMLGQTIYEGNASGDEFNYDFSEHEMGIYLIRIETASGVVVKKVSVTR